VTAGLGIEKVMRRKSGHSLAEPIQGFYTPRVFKEATGLTTLPLLVKRFAEEEWVWGTGGGVPIADYSKLAAQVTELYERDYIKVWDDILNDLEIVPFSTVDQYADALQILVGPTSSPLKGILKIVVDNTSLVPPEAGAPATAPSAVEKLSKAGEDLFNKAKTITGIGTSTPTVAAGALVTQHFLLIHRLMAGAPSPFDAILEHIKKIRDQLIKVGPQVGGASPLKALTDPALLDLWRGLQQDAANLPVPVNTLVAQIAQHAGGSVSSDATRELEKLYQGEVVARCRVLVPGRYPFDNNGSDITLADFGAVFGYGGLFDQFFTDNIEKLVDRSQTAWAWRPESVAPPEGMLEQFQRAERIRQMFFRPGSKSPVVGFMVRLSDLDSKATRFYISIDGARSDVLPGAETRISMEWPGADKRGFAVATFEDGIGAPEQAAGSQGPWAAFRLIDAGRGASAPAQPATDLNTTLRFHTAFHQVQVVIEAPNATSNPFASSTWRQFTCES
jgi:type VI secretion system protein ImpL